ncbi:MAG: helix-turn-helix domain-containing protein [Caulobacterales bacterium]
MPNGYYSPWYYSAHFDTLVGMDRDALKTLGARIRERRKSLGWSQEEMAGAAEIDRSYVGGVERGERNISFLTLCLLAQTLRCDVASLAHGLP